MPAVGEVQSSGVATAGSTRPGRSRPTLRRVLPLAAALSLVGAACSGLDSSEGDGVVVVDPEAVDPEAVDDDLDDAAADDTEFDDGPSVVATDGGDDTAPSADEAGDSEGANGERTGRQGSRKKQAGSSGLTRAEASRLAGARVLCSFGGPTVPRSVLTALRQGRASGVRLFADNVASQEQAAANAQALQRAAAASRSGAPAIVAIDQEGGIVKPIPGPPSASAESMGQWSSDEIVAEGRATGELLVGWGVNLDLAPVADVARPGGFIDRQGRSFGTDLVTAADGVVAFAEGLRLAGVASTLKHFPGLGSASLDTDDAVSLVDTAPGDLWTIDFVPFAAGIGAGTEVVMMSSAVYLGVDERPAVYSPVWVREVLRDELGFGGVVMSDALDAPALAGTGDAGARAVEAATAGVDLFIATRPQACATIHAALRDAIRGGEITAADARASFRRIDDLRRSLG